MTADDGPSVRHVDAWLAAGWVIVLVARAILGVRAPQLIVGAVGAAIIDALFVLGYAWCRRRSNHTRPGGPHP